MSKRGAANRLMFRTLHGLRHNTPVVARLSGTGTIAAAGIITVVCASGTVWSAGGQVYITASSGTNIGTLVGTA